MDRLSKRATVLVVALLACAVAGATEKGPAPPSQSRVEEKAPGLRTGAPVLRVDSGLAWQRRGRWLGDPSAVASSPREQFAKAVSLEAAGFLEPAAYAYGLIPKQYAFAPEGPMSLVRAARAWFRLKRYERSSQALRTRHRQYPDALATMEVNSLYLALGRVYMEQSQVKSARSRDAGADREAPSQPKPTAGSRARSLARAGRIFEEMLKVDPFGRYAHEGVYFLGQIAMARRDWSEAIKQFEKLLRVYKHSDLRPEAETQIARCLLRLHRHPERASEGRLEALERLDRAEIETRELRVEDRGRARPLAGEIQAIRKEILAVEAERWWRQALFYKKLGKLNAAEIYFSIIVKEYPTSARAAPARRQIDRIRQARKRGAGERVLPDGRAPGPGFREPEFGIEQENG